LVPKLGWCEADQFIRKIRTRPTALYSIGNPKLKKNEKRKRFLDAIMGGVCNKSCLIRCIGEFVGRGWRLEVRKNQKNDLLVFVFFVFFGFLKETEQCPRMPLRYEMSAGRQSRPFFSSPSFSLRRKESQALPKAARPRIQSLAGRPASAPSISS